MECVCLQWGQLQGLQGMAVSWPRYAAERSAAAQIVCRRRDQVADEGADAVDCPPFPVALIVALQLQAQRPGCFANAL